MSEVNYYNPGREP